MPLFAKGSYNDWDTRADYGNVAGGKMNFLVATWGWELETTEYAEAERLDFDPNQPLTVVNDGSDDTGKVIPTTLATTDLVVGVVSDGLVTNEYGKSCVRFWSVWMPFRTIGN
jgi:hypothetical protein